MAKERKDVTIDFVQQCKETIGELGAVRKSSFAKYLEIALDVSPALAAKIIDTMAERQDIYTSKYAGTTILKVDQTKKTVYGYLDIFDAFLCLYEEAKARNEDDEVFVNSGAFPVDFTFYDTSGPVYSVFLYDHHLPQKVSVFERKKKDKEKIAAITVFPVGTNLKKADVPKLNVPYRYAVVRKSETGNTSCQMTPIQTGESDG